MATVPNPKTWTALEDVTAAEMNTEIRDTANFQLAPPQCAAYRTAALSPVTSTWTVIPLDAEVYDTDTPKMHDLVTNPSRIIAQTPGKYLVTAQVTFASNATGIRQMAIQKNAAGVVPGGTTIAEHRNTAISGASTTLPIATQVVMAAGDYLELFGWQSSGAGLALTTGERFTYLEMLWIGV